MRMNTKFQNLFDKNGLPSARKISANPILQSELVSLTAWLNPAAGPAERLWNLFHGHTSYTKKCECCGSHITTFRSWTDGYSARFCSRVCQRTLSTPKAKAYKSAQQLLDGKERGKKLEPQP